jgi:Ca-activated chloride channel family protein
MIDHTTYKELLSAYVDGELNQEETSLVEDHLLACSECQKTYKELVKLSSTLKAWPDEGISSDLELNLNKALANKRRANMKPRSNFFKVGVGSTFLVCFILVVLVQTQVKQGIQGRLKAATDDIGDQYSAGNTSIAKIRRETVVGGKAANHERYPSAEAVADKKVPELAALQAPVTYEQDALYSTAASRKLSALTAGGPSGSIAVPGRGEGMLAFARQNESFDMGVTQEKQKEYWGKDEESDMPYPTSIAKGEFNTEDYSRIYENQFLSVAENALSTFSIDVDTASYSNIRRFLNAGQMPPEDAVRIEEMINYFTYDYPKPEGNKPFSITTTVSKAPWNEKHDILRVGLQGKTFENDKIPPSNLVFLIDSSGSMNDPNKMPLLKSAFKMFANQLREQDHVAIVVYAGAAGLVLESTPGSNKYKITQALDNLQAGGSTAGGAGIQLAYEVAKQNFIRDGNNRVILATDGDFNVGVSSDAELVRIIEEKRKQGVFLTVLGFGTGNYKDNKMEQLADKGNGNFYYIDTENEARKVLVSELGSTLFTIAKDVKIQIEFNPDQVKAYRLIGYENRILAKEDFNDDTKDAGEMGAGHTVTALYEIVPADSKETFGNVDDLKYQKNDKVKSDEMLTVKLRYKEPDSETSQLITQTVKSNEIVELKDDFKFAVSVAEFGLLLRQSEFKGTATYDEVIKNAQETKGDDKFGYRDEFVKLVEQAKMLDNRPTKPGVINFKTDK